ncbi:MAG: polysaccharide biosynthesis protein [Sphaerochaetaceae bacterium]|nr:polysaccharide biosynthesis protein [Sphaerochaetaceae bacterium]
MDINNRPRIRWTLVVYDLVILALTAWILLWLMVPSKSVSATVLAKHVTLLAICVIGVRMVLKIYTLIWRFGGIQSYIRIMFCDFWAFLIYLLFARLLGLGYVPAFERISLATANLLVSMGYRMAYRYAYKCANHKTTKGRFLAFILKVFAHRDTPKDSEIKKIHVAIVGAGRLGSALAEELIRNPESVHEPVCFIDVDSQKIGRVIQDLKVLPEDTNPKLLQTDFGVQQILFAVPDMEHERRRQLVEKYTTAGFKVLQYTVPSIERADKKPVLKEFAVEDLLFRLQQIIVDEKTESYYKDKVILVTGGGGSIGSEICRQLARMQPRKIIILDIYENCTYDIQQELRLKYRDKLDISLEICSITNYDAMERVFKAYHPQIVINAAAHKHVPLMEHNCIEAIENNIFGCRNVIDLCEKYHAKRFMMVSTDKAVNPTNVMGATKRFCEMMAQSESLTGSVKYSCTRFGNVLGSAGSVIPLFKRQIAAGGPITITDKRIIRYFMTIPEASQLVLTSGAMAKNGELFVLDMGKPVKILDLAQNMIKLSGAHDIEILETGLRPGEKLYEELLIKTEELDKTDNSLIFIERDTPLAKEEIYKRLDVLKKACATNDDDAAREALRSVVPTFKRPEEVNRDVK